MWEYWSDVSAKGREWLNKTEMSILEEMPSVKKLLCMVCAGTGLIKSSVSGEMYYGECGRCDGMGFIWRASSRQNAERVREIERICSNIEKARTVQKLECLRKKKSEW